MSVRVLVLSPYVLRCCLEEQHQEALACKSEQCRVMQKVLKPYHMKYYLSSVYILHRW